MNLEIEMKSNLQKGDAEITILNNKLNSQQKIFNKQKEDLENQHRKEIEDLEEKIKKSFMRKDEIIKKLQEDNNLKDLTIQKYEEMLNQQRKEFFGK
jgi:gamma-glutamyl-gamma-aminobutyrate hydrolase PuuD